MTILDLASILNSGVKQEKQAQTDTAKQISRLEISHKIGSQDYKLQKEILYASRRRSRNIKNVVIYVLPKLDLQPTVESRAGTECQVIPLLQAA
jgi:hypothetical protein